MDLSECYISMCSKAKEIQEGWNVKDGDYFQYFDEGGKSFTDFTNVHPHGGCFGTEHRKESGYGENITSESFWSFDGGYEWDDEIVCLKKDAVFLPRQDQLQEMVEEIKDKVHFVFRFDKFLRSKYEKQSAQPAYIILFSTLDSCSVEMLLLCFVMSEKFSKQWNGKDWVKS